MIQSISKKAAKWAGIGAIIAATSFSSGYFIGRESTTIHNKYLRLEQDVGATKKHELFLEQILADMDSEFTRKLKEKDEANALFDAFSYAMDKNNFVYELTTLLSDALEDRTLKDEIVECINKYGSELNDESDPDSINCSKISKKFIEDAYLKKKIDLARPIHKSDCDINSIIIRIFAEKKGIYAYMVNLPGHAFIRYAPPGKKHANFETTSRDVRSDGYYIADHKISKDAIENGVYMKNLDENGISSLIHFNKAFYCSRKKLFKRSEEEYLAAIQYDPKNTAAMHNLSVYFRRTRDWEKAIDYNNSALALNPNCPLGHDLKGHILSDTGKKDLAKKEYARARKLGFVNEKNAAEESYFK